MQIKGRKADEARQSARRDWSQAARIARVLGILLALALVFGAGILFHRSGYVNKSIVWIKQAPGKFFGEIQQEASDDLSLYISNGLETVHLDIPFESLQAIEAKRDEAVELGILLSSDEDYVPASMRFIDQPSMDIRLRLKGDWTDHLAGEKWSFRIHIRGDQGNILGLRRFSLQAPETRTFVQEWGLHQLYLREGILTTRYDFVNVIINGEYKGIYALEESFSTELMESQGRREGVLLRFDEDMVWENRANDLGDGYDPMTFLITDVETADVTLFREGRVIDDNVLSAEAHRAVSMLSAYQAGQLPLEDVFDIALLGKYFALTDLWGGNHGAYWHNIRFYYNPVTALLEPVGFDNLAANTEFDELAMTIKESSLFDHPVVREAYARELNRISNLAYLEELQNELEPSYDRYFGALKEEYGEDIPQTSPWDYLIRNMNVFQANLHPIAPPLYGTYQFRPTTDQALALQINLYSSFILPLELTGITLNETGLETARISPAGTTLLARYEPYPLLSYHTEGFVQPDQLLLATEYSVVPHPDEVQIEVQVRVAGLPAEDAGASHTIRLTPEWTDFEIAASARPQIPTMDSALRQHAFLQISEGRQTLFTLSGEWDVDGDLILPAGYGLEISAGTTLRFAEGAVLYSDGAPIHIQGTEELPVTLDAQAGTWGGVVVLHAAENSSWRFAHVKNTAAVDRDGWILTGGITFYESPVMIYDSYISTAAAEDAFNVISTDFVFEDTVFAHTPSDAFDGDFTRGEINACRFLHIGGDAVDVSGTQVTITDISIEDTADKGISAGERSFVEVEYFHIEDVGIGVASKDLSEVLLQEGFIVKAQVAGLAAYVKKPQYGPAFIQADNVSIDTHPDSLCQTGSTILREGNPAETQDFDVELLYTSGVVGN